MRQTLTPSSMFLEFTNGRLRHLGLLVIPLMLIVGVFVFWVMTQPSTTTNPEMMVVAQASSDATVNLPVNVSSQMTAEDYAIYSAALTYRRFVGRSAKLVVIKDRTFIASDESALRHFVAEVPGVRADTVTDFESKNKEVRQLENRFKLAVNASLINRDEMDKLMEPDLYDGWRVLHQKYPGLGGIISLSSVGFNEEKTQAIVYVALGCGPLCGENSFFLLTKEKGVWSVQSKVVVYVS